MARVALAICAALFGVGSQSGDESPVERSAFFGDLSQLEPGRADAPSVRYISATADFSADEAVVINPVIVWHASGSSPDRLPVAELRALAERVESAIRTRMFEAVDEPRASTLRIPAALMERGGGQAKRLAAAIDDRLVAAPGEGASDRLVSDTVARRDAEAFFDSRARWLAARLSALHQLGDPVPSRDSE
jgi:hypothetical protein